MTSTQGSIQSPSGAASSVVNFTTLPSAWNIDSEDLEKTWDTFWEDFEMYADITDLDQQPAKVKRAIFARCLGTEARAWCVAVGIDFKQHEIQDIKSRIETRIKTTTTQTLRDFNFWHHDGAQKSRESFDSYLARIMKAAAKCEFDQTTEKMSVNDRLIRSRLIIGLADGAFKEKLLSEDLSLQDLIKRCRAREAGQYGATHMKGRQIPSAIPDDAPSSSKTVAVVQHNNRSRQLCANCARIHESGRCWAEKMVCHNCNKAGHIARCCLSPRNFGGVRNAQRNDFRRRPFDRSTRSASGQERRVHMLQEDSEQEEEDVGGQLYQVCGVRKERDEGETSEKNVCEIVRKNATAVKSKWEEIIRIEDSEVLIKIDTGAEVSVLPEKTLEQISRNGRKINLHESDTKLVSYFGDSHRSETTCTLRVRHRNKTIMEKFFIIKANVAPTLSGEACESLCLVARIAAMRSNEEIENVHKNTWMEEFPTVFNGVGKIRGFQCRLQLKDGYTPVANPYRPIPQAHEEALKQELKRMMEKGVIARVEEPTEFVSNIVPVVKPNGKLRVCLDPIHLNKALKRNSHPMKRLEQIQSKLVGAKYFTTLDADEGFWQLSLDKKSSLLCTFATPWGRFRFLKMPFGILTASDEFQRATDEIFCKLEGVTVVIDDMLVWGATEREHNERLRKVLQRCKEVGLVLNKKKSQFGKTSVKYLGHILSQQGMAIQEERIKSIIEVPPPKTVKELQQFLGMVTYVGQFIDHLSDKTAALRELVRKNVSFDWQPVHQEAFEELKRTLTSAPVLSYFNPEKPIVLSVDASLHGVGAVLLQDLKPVAYASKSLNDPQTRWAQIEREMLAIVFGCERFHYYVYGRSNVLVETDHSPLEQIFRKSLHQIPLRLQQMRMSLQRYDITVQYRPGKEIPMADFLSRFPAGETLQYDPKICGIASVAITDERAEEYRRETDNDTALQSLRELYQNGWPNDKRMVTSEVKVYWPFRDEIHCENGLLLRSNRLIIPRSRQKEVLQQLHRAHSGEEKMKNRARPSVYWPTMNADIRTFVQQCTACQEHQKAKPKEPMIVTDIPSLPWEIVSADIMTHEGKDFQIVVDHYSFYFDIKPLEKLTSKHIIGALFNTFQNFGLPQRLHTDNGRQYVSHEFESCMKEHDIQHVTSSPYYPRGNAMAERAVQEAKKILRKVPFGTPNFYMALMEWRATPRKPDVGSPSQRLQGRQLRTLTPTHKSVLLPKTISPKKVQEFLKTEREKQKVEYDRGSKWQPEFTYGQRVRVRGREDHLWYPGTIVSVLPTPRSFLIRKEGSESLQRRNKVDIREVPKTPPRQPQLTEEFHTPPTAINTEDRPPNQPAAKNRPAELSHPIIPNENRRSQRLITKRKNLVH